MSRKKRAIVSEFVLGRRTHDPSRAGRPTRCRTIRIWRWIVNHHTWLAEKPLSLSAAGSPVWQPRLRWLPEAAHAEPRGQVTHRVWTLVHRREADRRRSALRRLAPATSPDTANDRAFLGTGPHQRAQRVGRLRRPALCTQGLR